MKKYLEVAKLRFKSQLAWRFDIMASVLISLVKILFAIIVWGAVFGTQDTVAGFTLQTMVSYYIINAFLSQLDMSESIASDVSSSIRGGTFSKYMILPVKVEGYFLWQMLGMAAMYVLFTSVGIGLCVTLFRIDFVITSDPVLILSAALMVLMGLIMMAQLNFFLGLLTLKFNDIGNFLMIKDLIMEFIKGGLIPLALLPPAVIAVMRCLPFYYITYLPSMLLIGRGGEEITMGLITLAGWMVILLAINSITYERLRRKYDGVGI